ncbi:DUF2975 domain-containing protein [bacterium]|nr:DUF2975 domain-containing protein [bacterium]
MNELSTATNQTSSGELTSRSLWLPIAIKWGLGIFWYGMIVVAGIALLFFIFAGAMTKQHFPFPFETPVLVKLINIDSLRVNDNPNNESVAPSDLSEDVTSEQKKNPDEELKKLDDMAFKAFAIRGDLMYTVPMRKLWLFLLAGFFTPTAVALVIAFQLRKIFRSVSLSQPFDSANIKRVKIIGWSVVALDPLKSLVAWWGARSLLPLVADIGLKIESAVHIGYQSILFGILILALVHIFETGARLQNEQELTI